MFKPGTLVKLAAGYEKYLGTIDQADYPYFWVDKTHIGLMLGNVMLGNDYDNRHVRILIGEDIVVINPDALSEILV